MSNPAFFPREFKSVDVNTDRTHVHHANIDVNTSRIQAWKQILDVYTVRTQARYQAELFFV